MPGKIRVLSENLIRKIAAGEVIERPASVVKELVENALDAQSSRVHVEMREGGRQAMVVADDGEGMTREDAELCVARHATSKLTSPAGLFGIATLGFRGEALASIGAVARLSIETRAEEDDEGTRIVVEGGIQRELTAAARARGTTVAVRNLFFNTPARRKFLRHVETESRYTAQAVGQLAAAHPRVGFVLVHQDRTVLEYAAGDRRTRAADVLGAGPGSLLVAQVEQAGVSAEVFLCPPADCRGSRGRQYLIVRSRPIVSRVLSQGVYRGYGGTLPTGAHPAFVVWLEVDPRQVDVNVHPTKREVRFAEENRVCELVESAVRQALNVIPSASFGYNRAKPGARPEQVREYQPNFPAVAPLPSDRSGAAEQPGQQISLSLRSGLAGRPATELPGLTGLVDAPVVWQLHRKYLVIPTEEGLLVVDQHVAHERVRYEEAIDRLQTETTTSQQLLFPLTLTVNAVELEALRPAQSLLERLGFGIREFGAGAFVVDSIPADMKGRGEGEVLYRIADDLIEEKRSTGSAIREALAASYACHTAIRAGEELAPPERKTLLARLAGTREPYLCPHGRPTMLRIPIGELDRMFGRT